MLNNTRTAPQTDAACENALGSSLRWDADLKKALGPILDTELPPCNGNPLAIRAVVHAGLAQTQQAVQTPSVDAVQEHKFEVRSRDGTPIVVHRFTPPNLPEAQGNGRPAIIYCHGGGLVAGTVESWAPIHKHFATSAGVTLYSVDYRLAPESPYPLPLEDVYATLEWLRDNAAEQNVDPCRIGIQGDSGGCALAAGVALLARDKAFTPSLAKQILICPMLDDRTDLSDQDPRAKYLKLAWTNEYNRTAWDAYLGRGSANNHRMAEGLWEAEGQYASPARVENLVGLPSTYIANGGLDLFVEEATEYALRLLKAGVEVELHINPGVFHGYSLVAPIPAATRSLERRVRAMNSF